MILGKRPQKNSFWKFVVLVYMYIKTIFFMNLNLI